MNHNYLNVTKEELDLMQFHHRKFEYTDAEQLQVFLLVKKYLNPHQSTCTSCQSNLRDAKTALNSFYLNYKEKIEYNLMVNDKAPIDVKDVLPQEEPTKRTPKKRKIK